MNHTARWLLKTRFTNVMTCFFAHHDYADIRGQFVIRSASQHLAIQVVIALRKQTSPYLSIRGQPHSTAVPAEGARHWCDNPYLSQAILKSEPLRRLAGSMWG